jgi:hypothetical protein
MEMMRRTMERVLEAWRISKRTQFELEINPILNSKV